MNILYITNHLNYGGITSYLLTLSSGMKKAGHNVFLASAGGELKDRFRQEGIECISIPMNTKKELSPKILFSLFELIRKNKRFNFQIIHAHTRTTQVLGRLLSARLKIPYLSTCHGFFKRRILRSLYGCWGDKVIAISDPVKEHLEKDFAVRPEDIAVIHNGIDIGRFAGGMKGERAKTKEDPGSGEGPVIGIVARLSDVKGHIYLIEAMQDILREFPLAKLLIVGEGKEKERLQARSRQLGIFESIIFHPSVADTREVLMSMDLFAMPSLKEGLGLGIMEAMASGLAIVASAVGGINSLIKDGVNGLLVEPKDTGVLADRIKSLLRDPGQRRMLGDNARDSVARNFSQDKMVSQTEGVYLKCLSKKS